MDDVIAASQERRGRVEKEKEGEEERERRGGNTGGFLFSFLLLFHLDLPACLDGADHIRGKSLPPVHCPTGPSGLESPLQKSPKRVSPVF